VKISDSVVVRAPSHEEKMSRDFVDGLSIKKSGR
jgi:hypothetical protein